MSGQWVEDCYNDSYDGAPGDGSAWIEGGNCKGRVVRGGSWGIRPDFLRSARRAGLHRCPGLQLGFPHWPDAFTSLNLISLPLGSRGEALVVFFEKAAR